MKEENRLKKSQRNMVLVLQVLRFLEEIESEVDTNEAMAEMWY